MHQYDLQQQKKKRKNYIKNINKQNYTFIIIKTKNQILKASKRTLKYRRQIYFNVKICIFKSNQNNPVIYFSCTLFVIIYVALFICNILTYLI